MPQTVPPDISVLVPVMNEQGNIRPLIDEIAAVYAGRSFEIIYVNDGSDDGTSRGRKLQLGHVNLLAEEALELNAKPQNELLQRRGHSKAQPVVDGEDAAGRRFERAPKEHERLVVGSRPFVMRR